MRGLRGLPYMKDVFCEVEDMDWDEDGGLVLTAEEICHNVAPGDNRYMGSWHIEYDAVNKKVEYVRMEMGEEPMVGGHNVIDDNVRAVDDTDDVCEVDEATTVHDIPVGHCRELTLDGGRIVLYHDGGLLVKV
jgi:hypothetical protein